MALGCLAEVNMREKVGAPGEIIFLAKKMHKNEYVFYPIFGSLLALK